jgi:proline dehydrogenase
MSKYQKPLRSAFREVFDVDMNYEKIEELMIAYIDFWATLDEEEQKELDLMLS